MSWTSNSPTDVSISVILVNAISFIVIVTWREDPLSTGMLDVFFPKILYHDVSLFIIREFMYSKIAYIAWKLLMTASTRIWSSGLWCSPIP